MGDEETVGGGAVHRILLVGKQPLLGRCLWIYQGYTHTIRKHPYHSEIIRIDILHLSQGLAWTLYIDDFCLEGAWIVDDHSQVSSYQELIACVLELIDAGYSGWEWYHIQLVVLIEYGESAIFCCQEDIIAHFSYPFEGDGSAELRVVDGGSLVSENPIAFFLICPDMPYVSASESVFAYLDELRNFPFSLESMDTYQIIARLGSYPGGAMFDSVYLIYSQIDVI